MVKSKNQARKVSSSSSLSSFDFRNRNSILLQRAENAMDIATNSLGVKFYGGRVFILKKYMELQTDNIAEKEIDVFNESEDGDFAETEDAGSLSLEF